MCVGVLVLPLPLRSRPDSCWESPSRSKSSKMVPFGEAVRNASLALWLLRLICKYNLSAVWILHCDRHLNGGKVLSHWSKCEANKIRPTGRQNVFCTAFFFFFLARAQSPFLVTVFFLFSTLSHCYWHYMGKLFPSLFYLGQNKMKGALRCLQNGSTDMHVNRQFSGSLCYLGSTLTMGKKK